MGTLASFDDANRWLDETKIGFSSDADAEDEASAAYETIAGKIGSIWPLYLPNWDFDPEPIDDEEATPTVVRLIASLYMASYRYAKKYSEENLGENDYSARLERKADGLLEGLVSGDVTLWDKDYAEVVSGNLVLTRSFWPNDDYTADYVRIQKENRERSPELEPARAFSMDMEF